MLVAVGAGSSSSLGLLTLGGDPTAETLDASRYFNSGNQLAASLSTPSFNGLTVTSIQYCPLGSAASVADKAFVALADTTGNASGMVKVISGLSGASPSISNAASAGLMLGNSDNIRGLHVDCTSGIMALVSRSADGSGSPSGPQVYVSSTAGATFKPVLVAANETLDVGANDLEAVALKSDAAAGTFDLVVGSMTGDVLTAQAKITDLSKASVSVTYKVVNDPSSQVALGVPGAHSYHLAFTPSDTAVANYIQQTGNQVTAAAHPQAAYLSSASGFYLANIAAAKTPVLKVADALTISAQVSGGAAATWTGAVTLPQDKTLTLSATANSKLPVSALTAAPCSITNNVLTSSASSGTCTVTFTTTGDATYTAATATRTVILAAATPKLTDPITVTSKIGSDVGTTWGANPVVLLNGNSLTVTASALSGLSVSTSMTSGPCTLVASTLTAGAAAGTCVLTFTTAGNGQYKAASETRQVTLKNKVDSLTVTVAVGAPPAAQGIAGGVVANGQSASLRFDQVAMISTDTTSKLPVQVSSSAGCSLINGVLTPLSGTGSCVVTFKTSAANGWDAINESRTFALGLAADSLTVSVTIGGKSQSWDAGLRPVVTYGQSISTSASAISGATVSIAASGACTITNGVLAPTAGTGSCTVSFTTKATANYSAVSASRAIDTAKASDTIVVYVTPDEATETQWPNGSARNLVFGQGLALRGVSNSGNQVAFSVTGNCSLTNGRLVATSGGGTCTVRAATLETPNYLAASTNRDIALKLATDAVTASLSIAGAAAGDWGNNVPTLRQDQTAIVSPIASSGRTVTLNATGNCSLNSGVITPTATIGSCVIAATIAADSNFAAATASWSLVLAPKPTIKDSLDIRIRTKGAYDASWSGSSIWSTVAITAEFGDQIELTATTTSGTVPLFSVAGPCTLKANAIQITKGTGTCAVTAVVANSDGYTGLSTKRNAVATPATLPTLSLTPMKVGARHTLKTSITIGGKKIVLAYAVAAASGSICSITGGTLTAKKKGTCSVVATAPGLAGYSQAFKQTLVVKVS